MDKCVLCDGSGVEYTRKPGYDAYFVDCRTCGSFVITGPALNALDKPNLPEKRFMLSALTRMSSESGKRLELTTENIDDFLSKANVPRTPFDVLDRLLLRVYERTKWITDDVLVQETDYPLLYLRSPQELEGFVRHLASLAYITSDPVKGGWECRLTLEGWKRVSELRTKGRGSSQAFVAMSFAPELEEVWTAGIQPALKDAGWDPMRVDKLEHNEKICDRIVAEIRRSGLIVADFSGDRPGVYFEAGYGLGLGLPVIWCVRSSELKAVHFDTRQYNHIAWETPEDLRRRLHDRVVATVGFLHSAS